SNHHFFLQITTNLCNIPKGAMRVDNNSTLCLKSGSGSNSGRGSGDGELGLLLVLGMGLSDGLLLGGLDDVDLVGKRVLGSGGASRVVGEHDLDLDTQNSLTELDVSDGLLDVVVDGVSGVDKKTVVELHRLGTLTTELSRDNDLATLGVRLHDETEDSVACTANGKSSDQLVAEGLALGNSAETAVGDLLGVKLNGSLVESESLLDDGGELLDSASALSEHRLGAGGHDDDLGASRGTTDLDTGVAVLGELLHEEVVKLSLEDSVLDGLLLLGDRVSRRHDCPPSESS
ncbi:hypothetical protein PFISCL1PPCAC_11913, partial [Pristionchus fissidentatus]